MEENAKEKVDAILAKVEHPAIARSLRDLGIVDKVDVEGDSVKVRVLFPFPNIPIADMLINSVRAPLEAANFKVEVETGVMNEEQVQAFLAMEQQGWKGM